jgi:hypothetical protein
MKILNSNKIKGLRLGFSGNFRFGLGFGFCFGSYFSKNPVFGWVFGFFKISK